MGSSHEGHDINETLNQSVSHLTPRQLHAQVNNEFQAPVLAQGLNSTFGLNHPLETISVDFPIGHCAPVSLRNQLIAWNRLSPVNILQM